MKDREELVWQTSSKSSGGSCVEVAPDGEQMLVRDSKDTAGPVLTFSRRAFRDFLAGVRRNTLEP